MENENGSKNHETRKGKTLKTICKLKDTYKNREWGTSDRFFEGLERWEKWERWSPHTPYIGRRDKQEISRSKHHKRSQPLDLHHAVECGGHTAVLGIKWSVANAEVSRTCAEQAKRHHHVGTLPKRARLAERYQNPTFPEMGRMEF